MHMHYVWPGQPTFGLAGCRGWTLAGSSGCSVLPRSDASSSLRGSHSLPSISCRFTCTPSCMAQYGVR